MAQSIVAPKPRQHGKTSATAPSRVRLGSWETLVLLAVLRLKKEGTTAYGAAIYDCIKRTIGREVAVGMIYVTLERLEKKKLVETWEGEPTPVRGGRRTRCVALTATAREALRDHESMWRRMSQGIGL